MATKKEQEELRKAIRDAEIRSALEQSYRGRDPYWDAFREGLEEALRIVGPRRVTQRHS